MATTPSPTDDASDQTVGALSTGALFTIAFLGLTTGVQMSDRGLQAILLSTIQQSFDVSDTTVGALQGVAGVFVASAIAIPVARLADRFSRKRIMLGLIAGWMTLTAFSAAAPIFPIFFIGRAACGVTEFAMVPIVYSMIPDLAPERYRVVANLSFAALMAAGASAGFFFGDVLVHAADNLIALDIEIWRKAFVLLSFFGMPLVALGLFATDPPRHLVTGDIARTGALAPFLRERWRAIGLFIGAAGSLMIAVQALNPLIVLALERQYTPSPGTVGRALGLVTFVSTIASLPIAGILDRVLRPSFGLAARPVIMGVSAIAAIPCMITLLFVGTLDGALVSVAVFLFLTCIANALIPTMLQDLTPVSLRARSFAIWSFVVSAFCAIGPLLAGLLSDIVLAGHLLSAIAVTALPALAISTICSVRSARHANPPTG